MAHRKILDKIVAKDSAMQGGSNRNPVRKAVNDLKFRVMNKTDWMDLQQASGFNATQGLSIQRNQMAKQQQIMTMHVSGIEIDNVLLEQHHNRNR